MQAQLPPQSSVPGWHSIVHITSEHVSSGVAGTQLVAWQHSAGTQSSSLVHSVVTTAQDAKKTSASNIARIFTVFAIFVDSIFFF